MLQLATPSHDRWRSPTARARDLVSYVPGQDARPGRLGYQRRARLLAENCRLFGNAAGISILVCINLAKAAPDRRLHRASGGQGCTATLR
jgi:hypothetical protein